MSMNGTQCTQLFTQYPDVLTVKQLQDALNIGRSCAYGLVSTGEFPSFRIGSAIRIPKPGVISYLHDNMEFCYNYACSDQVNPGCQKGDSDC